MFLLIPQTIENTNDVPGTGPDYILKAHRLVLPDDMLSIITQQNLPAAFKWNVIDTIEAVLSWSIGLRNLKMDDEIVLLWNMPILSGIPQESEGHLEALMLNSSVLDTTLYAYRFSAGGKSRFYDEEGTPWQRRFLRSPVQYGRISSSYNLARLNPVLKIIKAHRGTDFAAPEGSPVICLANGRIVKRDSNRFNGNYISVQHDSVYRTTYLHMKQFNSIYQIGDSVIQGDILGRVGMTGSATGPHVCLRFYRRDYQGDFVQAFPYLPKPELLPLDQRRVFWTKRDSLHRYLIQASSN